MSVIEVVDAKALFETDVVALGKLAAASKARVEDGNDVLAFLQDLNVFQVFKAAILNRGTNRIERDHTDNENDTTRSFTFGASVWGGNTFVGVHAARTVPSGYTNFSYGLSIKELGTVNSHVNATLSRGEGLTATSLEFIMPLGDQAKNNVENTGILPIIVSDAAADLQTVLRQQFPKLAPEIPYPRSEAEM
ncbi:MAG: hypothetical protein JWO47_142 [Candidatus Saccharibacteria bacterium]|nr:hypothetical protein [Candidatus Saccharibacteria bacterium]